MARFEISPNIGNISKTVDALVDYVNGLDDRIEEVAANIPSKMIVEELPEEGDPNITYYVGPKGTEPNYYYEVWVWVQEEPDGPFVWRELEDTDQVDLSGYLPIQDGVTTYPQVYQKNTDGTQSMRIVRETAAGGVIPLRDGDGQLYLPNQSNYAPSDHQAISKSYANDNFVAKQTGATSYVQVYAKDTDGTNYMVNVGAPVINSALVRRNGSGYFEVNPPTADNHPTTKKYVDDTFVAQDKSGVTSYYHIYCKNPNGTQGWVNGNNNPIANGIPLYRSGGTLRTNTPTELNDAANKQYVDTVVGQLIYHHDMIINYTTVGTDYVLIAAHSDNNDSTAYTGLYWQMIPLVVPDYAVYHHNDVDYMASVVKMPRSLHQDEFSEPQDGFLITYWNGSALVSERINSTLYTTPTVTDVVTTW